MVLIAALALVALERTRFGMTMGVPEGGGATEFVGAMRQQIRLGLDGAQLSVKWDEFEAMNGKIFAENLGTTKWAGETALLTISTIDTTKRRLPADVAALTWDDPKMFERFDGFLRKLVPQFGTDVRWLSLGNEVDGYLLAHPDETGPYIKFLSHERELLHQIAPSVKVGVTTMWLDIVPHLDLIQKLQKDQDIAVFTYYPTVNSKVLPARDAERHLAQMLAVADLKPLLLQEIGYPSSPACGSSEEAQADFVRSIYSAISVNQTKIAFASYFTQVDFSKATTETFGAYYGSSDPAFVGFLGSLGLQTATGKPKLAWSAFLKEMGELRPLE